MTRRPLGIVRLLPPFRVRFCRMLRRRRPREARSLREKGRERRRMQLSRAREYFESKHTPNALLAIRIGLWTNIITCYRGDEVSCLLFKWNWRLHSAHVLVKGEVRRISGSEDRAYSRIVVTIRNNSAWMSRWNSFQIYMLISAPHREIKEVLRFLFSG